MDIETLRANRRALIDAWIERRVPGETGVGPVLGPKDQLSIYVQGRDGRRTRDIVILPCGEIFESR